MPENITTEQNRALHLYFRLLAESLNESGYEMKRVLSAKINKFMLDLLRKALQESYPDDKDKLIQRVIDHIEASKTTADIPWNEKNVKEVLWRPVQDAMTGENSTQKLNKTELNEVYKVLNRHIAESTGVTIPFPSEEQANENRRS